MLLSKLKYCICDTAVIFYKNNYLSNSKQYVEITEIKYEILLIVVDSPQVQYLGHCYLLLINLYFIGISSIFKFIMYVDDITLFSTLTLFSFNYKKTQLNIL